MGDPLLADELREEIVSSFERHLRVLASPILDSPTARTQLLDQARSVLDEVVDRYRETTENVNVSGMSLSIEIGTSRAMEGVHPAESLRAAAVLFETALPFVLRAFTATGRPDAASGAALVLHGVIMNRLASSAVSYVGYLLRNMHNSHRAERARLARDLHDHIAHAVGVAIQNLELHDVHAGRDVALAQEKLQRAQEAMRQALDSIRDFSIELRTTVRSDQLEQALTDYLTTNAGSNVLTRVSVTGDIAMLPGEVCEEVYIMLREAIRNALLHSGTTQLDVTVRISESQLHACVSDTGRGFSVDETATAKKGIGLSSMRERVHLLGGALRLSSRPGHGTMAEIAIPLGRVLL
ncbi:MAG: sensor histidine kinase [Pseudonocardiaceae bacterium]